MVAPLFRGREARFKIPLKIGWGGAAKWQDMDGKKIQPLPNAEPKVTVFADHAEPMEFSFNAKAITHFSDFSEWDKHEK